MCTVSHSKVCNRIQTAQLQKLVKDNMMHQNAQICREQLTATKHSLSDVKVQHAAAVVAPGGGRPMLQAVVLKKKVAVPICLHSNLGGDSRLRKQCHVNEMQPITRIKMLNHLQGCGDILRVNRCSSVCIATQTWKPAGQWHVFRCQYTALLACFPSQSVSFLFCFLFINKRFRFKCYHNASSRTQTWAVQ